MSRLKTESDYLPTLSGVLKIGDYLEGIGYYTTHTDVSDLLQCGAFTSTSTPDITAIGKIIKRTEGRIDEKLKMSFRPEIIEKEVHNFDPFQQGAYPIRPSKDYIGFVQLHSEKIRKILRLEVYQGDGYVDMASASCTYTPPTIAQTGTFKLTFGVGGLNFELTENTANGFYDHFGQKTTVLEICAAINEIYPSKTAAFTGQSTQKKTLDNRDIADTDKRNISDFFYACPTEDAKSVYISSKLPSDAGTICTLNQLLGTDTTSYSFIDNQTSGRSEEYWVINDEGKIFFRTNYPYHTNHSIRVTYERGRSRVPASIHEATTKLVAAEILVTDDNTILIAETGSNIDITKKHEILTTEANAILDSKKNLIYLLD